MECTMKYLHQLNATLTRETVAIQLTFVVAYKKNVKPNTLSRKTVFPKRKKAVLKSI